MGIMFLTLLCVSLVPAASSLATDDVENPELLLSPNAFQQAGLTNDVALSSVQSPQGLRAVESPAASAQASFTEPRIEFPSLPPASTGESDVPALWPAEINAREETMQPLRGTSSAMQLDQIDQAKKDSQSEAQAFQRELDQREAAVRYEESAVEPPNVAPTLRPVLMHQRRHDRRVSMHDTDITSTRPGAKSGDIDTVKFGIFAKNFFGTNLKSNEFTVDIVKYLKWKDTRAASKVPSDMNQITMSGKQALDSIWMPEVVITNRGIRQHDIVSTAVTITSAGDVTKVERSGATINSLYNLEEYPFDTQKLQIKIASSKYMLDEVVLAPDDDKSTSGVRDGFFDGFDYELKEWKVYTVDEIDGALKKSRGVLEIQAKRASQGKWFEEHVSFAFLLLIISWAVFWFPFQNPFITPRLAMSILVLLAFTSAAIKSASVLPPGSPPTWNDVFNQQVQAMMFCAIVLNIFCEVTKHQYDLPDLANAINCEAKVLLPALSLILLTLVITAGVYKWLALGVTIVVTKVALWAVMCIYLGANIANANAQIAERQASAEEDTMAPSKTV